MKAVDSFCIDEFEYPNQKNNIPTSEVNLQDAKHSCEKAEKHLCSDKEWPVKERKNDAGPMAMHILHCAVSTLREERLEEQCPAGERKDCQTPEGVNDMTGNLWEWSLGTVTRWELELLRGHGAVSSESRSFGE